MIHIVFKKEGSFLTHNRTYSSGPAHSFVKVHFLLLFASGLVYGNQPIRITVTDTFGPSQANFQAVAQEVSAIVAERFNFRPPIDVPIICISGDNIPENKAFPGFILVILTAKEQRWAQMAFQLGHELGHVY